MQVGASHEIADRMFALRAPSCLEIVEDRWPIGRAGAGIVTADALLDLVGRRVALRSEDARALVEYRGDEGSPGGCGGNLSRRRSGQRGDRGDGDKAVKFRPQFSDDILA